MAPLEPERALTLLARLGEPPREIERAFVFRQYARTQRIAQGSLRGAK